MIEADHLPACAGVKPLMSDEGRGVLRHCQAKCTGR